MTNSIKSPKKKQTNSSQRLIQNLLMSCKVNLKNSAWAQIFEHSNPQYLEMRALEEMQHAVRCKDVPQLERHLKSATELITLARLKRKTYNLLDKDHVINITSEGVVELGSSTNDIEKRRADLAAKRQVISVPFKQDELVDLPL